MNEELKKYLEGIASAPVSNDDPEFVAYEVCGGNYDDTYELGTKDGGTLLARALLRKFVRNTTTH